MALPSLLKASNTRDCVMEDIDSSPMSSGELSSRTSPQYGSPPKHLLNLQATQFAKPLTTATADKSSDVSPACASVAFLRESSPATSISTLTSIDPVSPKRKLDTDNPAAAEGNKASGPPAKRRKLTPAEQEEQRIAKEAKAAARAEIKSKREEEKRLRDEEKRLKAEEREAKKREKELEEQRKTDAKLKKDRSQMRLGVFFQRSAATDASPNGHGTLGSARGRSFSREASDGAMNRARQSESPCKLSWAAETPMAGLTPAKASVSDYHKFFLPFQLQAHCSLPGSVQTEEDIQKSQDDFDDALQQHPGDDESGLRSIQNHTILAWHFIDNGSSTRGAPQRNMRELVDEIQGSFARPVDLTSDDCKPMDMLHTIARRHIQFQEDVRPAYFGTYSKIRSPETCHKMRRNPFTRGRKDTDYDYDSEAEWQEEEEGEELGDEDDDEADSVGDGENEMDEFLDDEDDILKVKRKLITGDLVPTSTGLCWEDGAGVFVESAATISSDLRNMRIGFLLPGLDGMSIDPFSTAYWETDERTAKASASSELAASSHTAGAQAMGPPRAPLQPRPNSIRPQQTVLQATLDGKSSEAGKTKRGRKPTTRVFSTEDFEEFKSAIHGSQLSKIEILKELKTRFPKLTHDMIKETLGQRFAQIGASKADKKWVYVPDV